MTKTFALTLALLGLASFAFAEQGVDISVASDTGLASSTFQCLASSQYEFAIL